jgi:hypothetical protein
LPQKRQYQVDADLQLLAGWRFMLAGNSVVSFKAIIVSFKPSNEEQEMRNSKLSRAAAGSRLGDGREQTLIPKPLFEQNRP